MRGRQAFGGRRGAVEHLRTKAFQLAPATKIQQLVIIDRTIDDYLLYMGTGSGNVVVHKFRLKIKGRMEPNYISLH